MKNCVRDYEREVKFLEVMMNSTLVRVYNLMKERGKKKEALFRKASNPPFKINYKGGFLKNKEKQKDPESILKQLIHRFQEGECS